MALSLDDDGAQAPPEPQVAAPMSFNERVQAFLQATRTKPSGPLPPDEKMPTTDGLGEDMDLQVADQLHQRACRWLETVAGQVAQAEAAHLTAKARINLLKEVIAFTYGSVNKAPQEQFDELRALKEAAITLEAEYIAAKGMKGTLTAVKVAASRCITRHTKANL